MSLHSDLCFHQFQPGTLSLVMDIDGSTWKRRRRQRPLISSLGLIIIVGLVLLVNTAEVSASIFNLGRKRFSYEGLINAGSVGLENLDGQVAAFGDFNGDSALDLFIINSDATGIDVYLWDRDSFSFHISSESHISVPSGQKVVNIIPADFSYDGKLDLLVMTKGSNAAEIEMVLWLGNIDGGFVASSIAIPSASTAQPFTLDATGDMHADLLGYKAGSKDRFSLWKNTFDQSNGTIPFELVEAPLQLDPKIQAAPSCQLAEPHSSAYIDLDGDCLADLFLVCAEGSKLTYQIWIASKGGDASEPVYIFARSGTLPPGTGALSFADMDRDGTIDVVFPSCEGSHCFINVAYNRQMPLCRGKRSGWFGVGPGEDTTGEKKEDCRDPESNLCVADSQFAFDFTVNSKNDQLMRIAVGDITPENELLITDTTLSQSIPIPLSLGDHNKDGYPDMAIITKPQKGGRDETRLRLLTSIPCNSKGPAQPGCPIDVNSRSGKRTFLMMTEGTQAINVLNDVRSVSFFDMAEDGSLDLLLQRLPASGRRSGDTRQISFIQNNFFYDAFMLKVMTSNGACASYCEIGPKRDKRYKPWGVNYGGASYKFTVLDTNGIRRAQQVGQLAQTAYRSLLTPYSYFGLGRTNNYVESLFIGTTKRRETNFIEMEGVIPNSQVMVLPWEEVNGDAVGDGSTWKKELYLSPGDWIPWVMVVLITIIVILLGFVFVLHLNEKREDERERKRAVHAINFDAL